MDVDGTNVPDKPLDSAVLLRLKQFSAMNKLKKMAYRVIAERLSEEEIGGLKELFKKIDTGNTGAITFDELKDGLLHGISLLPSIWVVCFSARSLMSGFSTSSPASRRMQVFP